MLPLLFALLLPADAPARDPYLEPVGTTPLRILPILTVGDRAADGYLLHGVPDGMGVLPEADGGFTLFVNHELRRDKGPYHPGWGGTGAFVSRIRFSGDLAATGGRPAFEEVRAFSLFDLEHRRATNVSLSRLCSATLALPRHHPGLTGPIHLSGEETGEGDSHDRVRGGSAFAVIDGVAWALPRLGRLAFENVVMLRGTGDRTVLLGLEDGPETPDSQLYLFVGGRRGAGGGPLERNGLAEGSLDALALEGGALDEGGIPGKGMPHRALFRPVGWARDGEGLERDADAQGALGFVRIEDGAQDKTDPRVFWFVTTGSAHRDAKGRPLNHNGRLYRFVFDDLARPRAGGTLELVLDGSEGIVSPDNVDIDARGRLLVCEDPTYPLGGARDSSLWLFDTRTGSLARIAQVSRTVASALDPDYRPGKWELSGVVDASEALGDGWWLVNVQAHYEHPRRELVEGGQILALRLD